MEEVISGDLRRLEALHDLPELEQRTSVTIALYGELLESFHQIQSLLGG